MIRAGARRGAWRFAWLAVAASAVGAGVWLGFGEARWSARAVLVDSGPSIPLAFSPDGGTLATVGPGGIALWDVAKGRRQGDWKVIDGWLGGRSIEVVEATYTPEGQDLVVLYRGPGQGPKISIDRVDPASGVVRSMTGTGFELAGPGLHAFNAEGRRFRLVLRGANLGPWQVVDLDVLNGEILASRALSAPESSTPLAVSPDTRFLALALPGGAEVCLWALDGDRAVLRLAGGSSSPARSAGFAADGLTLAIGREDGAIELWDILKGALRSTWRAHKPGLSSNRLRFAPNGSALASSGDRAGLHGYDPGGLARLAAGAGGNGPAGETIVLDPVDGRLLGRAVDEGWPELGPDGDVLATGSRKDGRVRLRKLPGKPERPDPLGKRHNPWF